MTCPACRIESQPGASICDCGYSFDRRIQTRAPSADPEQIVLLRSIARSAGSIRTILVVWSVLASFGAVLAAIQYSAFTDAIHQLRPPTASEGRK